tara:strand:- start:31 stop:1059 length:1029 start_codon:yes stop_codon:yes gene_type:complete
MAFQKVEFEFPEDDDDNKMAIEETSAVEIDITGKKTAEDFAADEAPEDKPESKKDSVDDDLEIEVVDDTPKADRGRKPSEPPEDVTEDELEKYSEQVQKRIKHFTKGYHDERRAKEEALRERQELERVTQTLMEENKKLKGNVNKNQTALLEQAKKNAVIETETAKRAYKEAYESGDSDAVLEAQEKLTNAKLKSDKLANFKIPALQEEETPVQPEPEPAPAVQVDERASDWQKANSWFGNDDEMTSLALGLHNKLVKQGVSPQSDEYYETIDSRMRQVFPDNFEEAEPKRKKTQVVAPATRSTAPKKVTLTKTQVQLAKRLGLTPQQYAKQVALDMRKQNG